MPGSPVQFGPPVEPTTVKAGEGFTGIGLPENDIFYFHPDHLGSTSYISNKNGSISQHVEYIAFGEVLFEEHSSSFSSPYLFNGKELDKETGMSYYGARYYEPKTSVWISVDPLAVYNPVMEHEFYGDGDHNGGVYNSGNLNSYGYCYQNPVRYVDPNGKQVDKTSAVTGAAITAAGLTLATEIAIAGVGPEGVVLEPAALVVAAVSVVLGGSVILWDSMTSSDDSDNTPTYNATNNKAKEKTATTEPTKAEARAEKLSKKQREGQDFTRAGKEAVKDLNKEKYKGTITCEGCKTPTTEAKQDKKGVTPASTDTNVDHVKRKRDGGSGTPDNGQVLCRGCNLKKG